MVHGGVQMRVRAHSKENNEIPSQCDAVDEEEQARMLSYVHQTLQKEVLHHSAVELPCLHDHLLTHRVITYLLCNCQWKNNQL